MKKVLLITLAVMSPFAAHGMSEERDLEIGTPYSAPDELVSIVSSGVYYPQMQCEQHQIMQQQPIIMVRPYEQLQPIVMTRIEHTPLDYRTLGFSACAIFAVGVMWGINIGMSHSC